MGGATDFQSPDPIVSWLVDEFRALSLSKTDLTMATLYRSCVLRRGGCPLYVADMLTEDILVEGIYKKRIDFHCTTRRATLMGRVQKALNLVPVAEKVVFVKLERGDTVFV
jgi:hypothetical protein